MDRKYRIISADSHLDIRAERWTRYVPEQWRDRAPRTARMGDGSEAIIVENRAPRSPGATTITGIPYEQHGLQEKTFNGPGTGSPEQRLKEQDIDGVDAEVLFTHSSYLNLWRGISDDEAYKAVIRAYNRWLAEDYCSVSPNRLIAMGVIPDTGVEDAIAEMEYCAKAGLKGVSLSNFPAGKSCPTPEDDRFWAAALETKVPITAHSNSGTTRFGRQGPYLQYPRAPKKKSNVERDPVSLMFRFAGDQPTAPSQLAMAGVFDRFPELRIYWAETQIGWLPYALVQIDDNFIRNRYWGERDYGMICPAKRPSDYLREYNYWGFMKDPFGVRMRHDIGVDKLMWGSDFAHATGDWPNSLQVIEEIFNGVPEEEKFKMLVGNAIEFFHLDPSVDLNG